MPARVAAASDPEFLANAEQGAGCAKAEVQPLRIGPFSFFCTLVHPSLFQTTLFHMPLFHPIVRRFLRDDNVMHVALAQSRGGDSNEPALLLELLQRRRTNVAHAAS